MINEKALPSKSLPRQSLASKPMHLRLGDICRKAILDGEFASGDRFPSERELAQNYGVSRATANKVISALITEGLLELQTGLGTRVRKRRTLFASLRGMDSFTTQAIEQGLAPRTEVLVFNRRSSSELVDHVREGLGIPRYLPESIIYIERLRLADDIPVILEHRWVRELLAPGLEKEDVASSFYRMLEQKFNLQMTGEQHTISAVLLGADEASTLQQRMPCTALKVEGSGFIRGDTPLWYQRLYYRADRYKLHNETRGPAASKVEMILKT